MTIHPEVIALLRQLATGKPRLSQESSHAFSTINKAYRNFSSAPMQINNLLACSPQSRLNRRGQMQVERESTEPKKMVTTQRQERLAREREEIAARVATFKATQEKFQREREEFFRRTWRNIGEEEEPKPFWS
jgi:hypothetical protein